MKPVWIYTLRCLPFFVGVAAASGGWLGSPSGTGYYHVHKSHGIWWLVAPDGSQLVSKGIDEVAYGVDANLSTKISAYQTNCERKYGSQTSWEKATAKRLAGWSFNTVGAWSDDELSAVPLPGGKHLSYAPILNLGASFVSSKNVGLAWKRGLFPDVFDPNWPKFCARMAQKRIGSRIADPNVLGWFLDNELHWSADWRSDKELLTLFMSYRPGTAGRIAADNFVEDRYGPISSFNYFWYTHFASWKELELAVTISQPHSDRAIMDCRVFSRIVAKQYFKVAVAAVRAYDPNHLILGCRFARYADDYILREAADYLDVISLNNYDPDPSDELAFFSKYGRPILVSEFCFRARDSGLPNTIGSGPMCDTQADRGVAFSNYAAIALSQHSLIGYQWFAYADEPASGRFDGENSNIGVVDIQDSPHGALVDRMRATNLRAEEMHEYAHP